MSIYFDFPSLSLTFIREKKREKDSIEIQSCILCHNNARQKHVTKAFPFVSVILSHFVLNYRRVIKKL